MINLSINPVLTSGPLANNATTRVHEPSVKGTDASVSLGGSATVSHLSTLALQLSEAHTGINEPPLAVSAAGRDLMLERIFRGHEPPVSSGAKVGSLYGESVYNFLTYEDRALVSQMYAYTQSQGADLTYVDRVAFALGDYRHLDDGRRLFNANSGHHYDSQGYQLRYDYLEKDAATANRILNGNAINSTRFDQGFLHHILDPGFGALASFGNSLGFLEKMVMKFSSDDTGQSSLGSEFANYIPVDVNDNVVITRSKEVMFTPPEHYTIKHNGIWTITEKGKAAGYTMDKVTGRPRAPAPVPEGQARVRDSVTTRDRQMQERAFLEALSRSRDLPNWLRSLLTALRKTEGR